MRKAVFYNYIISEDGTILNSKGTVHKLRINNGTYETKLVIDGISRYVQLHRIIYYLFVKKYDLYDYNICIIAKDGNFLNLDANNLELVKRSSLIHGQKHKFRAKLSDEDVENILAEYKGPSANQFDKVGPSYRELSNKYGVTKSAIASIIRKESRNKEKYKLD